MKQKFKVDTLLYIVKRFFMEVIMYFVFVEKINNKGKNKLRFRIKK